MFRLVGALLALLITAVAARADSELRTESMPSGILGRPFPFLVYLPDGYSRGELRYPVLYLLHGAGGDETAWSREGGIKATADRLIASGDIPPAIIVMPGCAGCWWVDSTDDKAESAFWSDLVPAVSKRFRVIDSRRGRLLAGLSAGGYGAVRFAMNYPDRVAAAAALSPAVYADQPPAHSAARKQAPFLKPDGSFDLAMWRNRNYPSTIDAYCRQKQQVAFYLVSGDNDNFGIAFETVTLFKRLYEHQPALAELRIVDGDHSWAIWSKSIEGAMRYLFKHADQPVAVAAPAEIAANPARPAATAPPVAAPPSAASNFAQSMAGAPRGLGMYP